ncbi:hypothetical protein Dsin_011457 [Dipteronia sinensis]|uniref:GDSL esterase/lipase n=1 Tax=Dipteronia sinensis TaxID=43782 RepID=A0AAE0AUN2_9ROSI|nr:hypothetical protein Dsin_011457 [Dipteronia sinensis]
MAKIVLESSLYVFLLFLCIIVDVYCLANKVTVPATPTIFIFGDSIADVGTNNFLPASQSRANLPYNGIDFLTRKPTGRFSNGYASADHIGTILGEHVCNIHLDLNSQCRESIFNVDNHRLKTLGFDVPLNDLKCVYMPGKYLDNSTRE